MERGACSSSPCLLEVCIGTRSTRELVGAKGIERLGADMLARLNEYLETEGAGRLNAVAIQDFWYTRP